VVKLSGSLCKISYATFPLFGLEPSVVLVVKNWKRTIGQMNKLIQTFAHELKFFPRERKIIQIDCRMLHQDVFSIKKDFVFVISSLFLCHHHIHQYPTPPVLHVLRMQQGFMFIIVLDVNIGSGG
jgi:hypothetical protein